jgi:hypothetical protein
MPSRCLTDAPALSQAEAMSFTKPMLGLALGGVLGLLDGLSGFFEPPLAPVMGSVITFSLLKGLLSRIATGYVSERVRSLLLGTLAGIGIAAALSLVVILRAGNGFVLGHPPAGNAARGHCGIRNAKVWTCKGVSSSSGAITVCFE